MKKNNYDNETLAKHLAIELLYTLFTCRYEDGYFKVKKYTRKGIRNVAKFAKYESASDYIWNNIIKH